MFDIYFVETASGLRMLGPQVRIFSAGLELPSHSGCLCVYHLVEFLYSLRTSGMFRDLKSQWSTFRLECSF